MSLPSLEENPSSRWWYSWLQCTDPTDFFLP